MEHFCRVPSLRSLCCMAVQVFGLKKGTLPIEVKETIKEIKAVQKPRLARYIVLRGCHFGAYTEFAETTKDIMGAMTRRDGDFLTLFSRLREECSIFRSLVKFIPTETERRLLASMRETLALALIREYSAAKRRFLVELVFWIGPEKAGNFWC
ncbi:hypothetical protein A9K97_gp405 [Tokyovirus A1]|uniref:hypothetical protein n=1 Tax=Tokyovirus A1 TaxID=1826170 RepID=UPI0007A96AB0|nr:hypothetical protein A9K97_gp405 [Tokyovirus A1]BAU79946.1 hypothetical protein [Tokyovirus A1]